MANRAVLVDKLTTATGKKSSREWTALLRKIKVPCGPIQSIDQVFADTQVLSRNMVVEVEHPELGRVKTVANPIKFSSTPAEYPKAPPLLGEDTESILSDILGLPADEIAGVKQRGVL